MPQDSEDSTTPVEKHNIQQLLKRIRGQLLSMNNITIYVLQCKHYCTGVEEELSFTKTKLKLERGRVMELQVMEESTIRLKQDLSKVMAENEQLKAQTKQLEGKPIWYS